MKDFELGNPGEREREREREREESSKAMEVGGFETLKSGLIVKEDT